jgi:hypothetical protein
MQVTPSELITLANTCAIAHVRRSGRRSYTLTLRCDDGQAGRMRYTLAGGTLRATALPGWRAGQ